MLPHSHIQQMLFYCRISQRDMLWEKTTMDFHLTVYCTFHICKGFLSSSVFGQQINLSAHFFRSKRRNAAYYSIISHKFDPSLIWFLHIFPWRNTSRFILPHMCICTVLSSSLSAQRCERQAKNVAV